MGRKFNNPWGKENSEWFNEEKNKWFDNEFIQTIGYFQHHLYKCLLASDDKGWLNVREDNGNIISISKYCRVNYRGFNDNKTRELFTILDWPHVGVKASVSAISSTKSRFESFQFEKGGLITFERNRNRLRYGNSEWIHAATDPSDPVPKGIHNLWLPDYYHKFGEPYLDLAKYATVWFRIGDENSDRYLHVGNVSLGCVSVGELSTGGTVSDKKKWDDIYNYLIRRRNSNKFVGKIKVV